MKQNKLNKWLDTPWTNRTYVKYCAGATAIGAVIGAIWAAWFNREEIHDWARETKNDVKEKFG